MVAQAPAILEPQRQCSRARRLSPALNMKGLMARAGNFFAAHRKPVEPSHTPIAVAFHGQSFVRAAPSCFYEQGEPCAANAHRFLARATPMDKGEAYEVMSPLTEDLGVGASFRAVRRSRDGAAGYVLALTMAGDMSISDDQLWAAEEPELLRSLVEVKREEQVLYAPNLLLQRKLDEALAFISSVTEADWNKDSTDRPHPLQVGSEANRLALFALSSACDPARKEAISALLLKLVRVYFTPFAMGMGQNDAASWAYGFDFPMPWHAKLTAPWHSGYAAAAITGALACIVELTGDAAARELLRRSVAFINLPIMEGGPLYQVNGLPHLAEYVTAAHAPNYRTFDGEVMSIPYLYNAAVLTGDDELMALVLRLIAGIKDALVIMSPQGAMPRFGMDGQEINRGYMLQMWFVAQILANITKDGSFMQLARSWSAHVPPEHRVGDFPR